MTYGIKIIHTHAIGEPPRYYYEELILKVHAKSIDDAYDKAGQYMKDCLCEYTNVNGEIVRTARIEAVDCFLIYKSDDDVQEMYSRFLTNKSSLSDEEYYQVIASSCNEDELRSLRNMAMN